MTKFEPFTPLRADASQTELEAAFNQLGRNVENTHACLDAFREESRLNQETLLRALRLLPEQKQHKSLFTMTRASAAWRVGGVVFAGLMAAPLASKIIAAVWASVTAVLLK